MKVVKKISITELKTMAEKMDGNLVKADVDVAKRIIIVDMPMHFEGEQELLEKGSRQKDLWGVNLFPKKFGTHEFIAFESLINIKPHSNKSMTIQSEEIRNQIMDIINKRNFSADNYLQALNIQINTNEMLKVRGR